MRPDSETATLLEEVVRASAAIREAEDGLREAVARARAAGLSYATIGKALGVSRQAAWERFGRLTQGSSITDD